MPKLITKKGNIVYQILSGRCNSYLISTPEFNILVDTGKSSAYKRLWSRICSLNLPNKKIDFLLITHTHFDHCQNAALIKERHHCKIMLSENDNGFAKQGYTPLPKGTNSFAKTISFFGSRIFWRSCRYRPFAGDVLIKDYFERKMADSEIRIIKTVGHSQGSVSVIVDNEIAIVGDALFGVKRNSVFPPFADNTKELINSWKILLDTGSEIFLPGHGNAIKRDVLKRDYAKYSNIQG